MKLTKPEWLLIGITGGYMFLSPFVYFVVGDFLHFFLIWNMILAMIPFFISKIIFHHTNQKKWITIGLLILWILFLPNAFYMITDLIYLSNHTYIFQEFIYSSSIYYDHLIPWLALFHILLGVVISLIWGFYTLFIIEDIGRKVFSKKLVNALIVALLFISSVGVYIGRFFRYNSWNFFSIFAIVKDLFRSISGDMLFFIFGYTFVLLTLYLLIKVVKNLSVSLEK